MSLAEGILHSFKALLSQHGKDKGGRFWVHDLLNSMQMMANAELGIEAQRNFEFAFDSPHFSDRTLEYVMYVSENAGEEKEEGVRKVVQCKKRGALDGDKEGKKRKVVLDRIHVSSAVLGEKSDFFKTLFSNGMSESLKRNVEIQVADREGKRR